eukprot:scaffold4614_cov247-Pinguiococcus_pyrenoidosus.AAC.11
MLTDGACRAGTVPETRRRIAGLQAKRKETPFREDCSKSAGSEVVLGSNSNQNLTPQGPHA